MFAMLLLVMVLLAQLCHADAARHRKLFPVTLRPSLMTNNGLPPLISQMFEPQSKIVHYTANSSEHHNPRRLTQHTWTHDTQSYVNLELIEPYLKKQEVKCDHHARLGKHTKLHMFFEFPTAYSLAKQIWQEGGGILFVVEGEKCFEGPFERSVYHSTKIEYDDSRQQITIKALPVRAVASVHSNWARGHELTHVNIPPHFYPEPRLSSGIKWSSKESSALMKRDGGVDIDVKHIPLHLIIPGATAVVCTAIGLVPCQLVATAATVIAALSKPSNFDVEVTLNATLGERKEWTLPFKRSDDKGDASHWTNLPKLTVACLDCHALGRFEAGFKLEFDILPNHEDSRPGCTQKRSLSASGSPSKQLTIQKRHEAYMEILRVEKHRRLHETRLSKRDVEDCKAGVDCEHDLFDTPDCPIDSPNWPDCDVKHLEDHHNDCGGDHNFLLRPTLVIKEAFHCIGESLKDLFTDHGDEACWDKFVEAEEEFDGVEDYVVRFVKEHIKDAEAYFIVHEPIDMQVQLEFFLEISTGMWFDADFYPSPKPPFFEIVPSAGWYASSGSGSSMVQSFPLPQDYTNHVQDVKNDIPRPWMNDDRRPGGGNYKPPDPKDPKTRTPGHSQHQGWGKMPWAMTPLRLEATMGGHMSANLTLPGFRLSVQPGEIRFRPLAEDKLVNTVKVTTEYLEADFHLGNDTSVTLGLAVGPALDFTLIPSRTKSLEAAAGAGIGPPLSFGGHLQLARLEVEFKEVPANDTECAAKDDDGQWKGGFKFGVYLRHGLLIYGSFFGLRIDGTWFGKLQDASYAIPGLFWSWRLHESCHELPQWAIDSKEGINGVIHRFLHEIQQPIKQIVGLIGEALSGTDVNNTLADSSTFTTHGMGVGELEWNMLNYLNPGMYSSSEAESNTSGFTIPKQMTPAESSAYAAMLTYPIPTSAMSPQGALQAAACVAMVSSDNSCTDQNGNGKDPVSPKDDWGDLPT